jgi:glycosyltransferase involved in cell wall biosynthesis
MHELAIIIPGYNVEKYLRSCLNAIYNSTYRNYEIIYVDDCSTDKSKEIALSFNCRVVSTENNSGPSVARNVGARNARSEYLLFIDADTVVPTDAIAMAVNMAKEREGAVICGRYTKEPLNEGFFQKYYCLFKYYIHRDYLENCVTVLTWFFVLKRECFIEAGGFAEIKGDFEGEEFGRRLSKKCNIIHTPEIKIGHNWCGFLKLHKIYFFRVMFWVKRFLGIDRTFNDRLSTKGFGYANLSGGMAWVIGIINIISIKSILFLFLQILLIVFLLIPYIGFFRFALLEVGWRKTFLYVLVKIYFSMIVFLGASYGFFSYYFDDSMKNRKMHE